MRAFGKYIRHSRARFASLAGGPSCRTAPADVRRGEIAHLLRTMPPEDTAPAAHMFDETVLKSYEALARLNPLTPEQQSQCHLPLSLGGRGLRNQAALAPAAWCASWAQCVAEVRVRTWIRSLSDIGSSPLPLAMSCQGAAANLPALSASEPRLCWAELGVSSRPKLQKVISKSRDKKRHEDLLSSLDEEGRARLRSCGGPLAGAWQLASPATLATRLDDREYAATARTLLGLAVLPDSCTCCNVAGSGLRAAAPCGERLCARGHHAHRCNRGGWLNARSRDLEDVWEALHRECGYTTARQVHVPAWDRWRWVCGTCASQLGTRNPGDCPSCGRGRIRQREETILSRASARESSLTLP